MPATNCIAAALTDPSYSSGGANMHYVHPHPNATLFGPTHRHKCLPANGTAISSAGFAGLDDGRDHEHAHSHSDIPLNVQTCVGIARVYAAALRAIMPANNKTVFGKFLRRSPADNVALLLTAGRAAIDRYLLPAGPAAAIPAAACGGRIGQTDRQTDGRQTVT